MATDSNTVTLPASVARDMPEMTQDLIDRMHELLERNTEGTLGKLERQELKVLVEMADFAQVFAMMLEKHR